MCIRDSSSTGHMIITEALLGMKIDEFTKAFTVNIQFGAILSCLLYTSDACRRIERCPSRGLGDVYKRQFLNWSHDHYRSLAGHENRRIYQSFHREYPVWSHSF